MAKAPLTLGILAVALFVGPAFFLFGPRDTREVPGVMFLAAAAAGFVLLTRTAVRLGRMMVTSRRVLREWARHGEPVQSITLLPAMRIDAGHPVVAVGGLTRSSLFIDHRVLTACSGEELEAIAAHELGHVKSGDNAKRLVLAAIRGFAHPLVTAWRDAAELDADRFAASDEKRGLALASALVKIARVATSPRLDPLAASGVYEGGSIETRVRALLSTRRPVPQPRWTAGKVMVFALPALVSLTWKPVHDAIELVVNYLP